MAQFEVIALDPTTPQLRAPGASDSYIVPRDMQVKSVTDTVYSLTGTDINPINGQFQSKTLSANTTFTATMASGKAVTLEITAGSYTITWPTITWLNTTSSTTAPTLNTSGVTIIELFQIGSTLYGSKVA